MPSTNWDETVRRGGAAGLDGVVRRLAAPAVAPAATRKLTEALARVFAAAGAARTRRWLLSAAQAVAGGDALHPAFRLSSEMAAAGIDRDRLAGALAKLGTGRRHARIVAAIVANVAGAYVRRQAALRRHLADPATAPPPVRDFILATTVHCNLHCVGCYTESQRAGTVPSDAVVDGVLTQGKRLGLMRVHLVGKGEPFLNRPSSARTVEMIRRHPDLLFNVFTNAVSISEPTWAALGELPNVVLVTSINGLRTTNDASRGAGVFDAVMRACLRANVHGVPHAFSVTVTADNYEEVTSPAFVAVMDDAEHLFGVYFKYAALDPAAPTDLALTPTQVADYESRLRSAGTTSRALLVDPDVFERGVGCRARSGQLLYVDLVSGSVTPCVRTPFAPPEANVLTNFHGGRLAEVLTTPFFRRYRDGARPGVTCSSHGTAELDWFLGDPDLPAPARRTIARELAAQGSRRRLPVLAE